MNPVIIATFGMMMCLSSSGMAAVVMMGGSPEVGAVCTPEGTKDPNATYKYDAQGKCAMTCKTGYTKESDACIEEEKEEVFQIKGYDYTKDQASGQCSAYGATVATRAQVDAAQAAGADWCSTGWVSDQAAAVYPINTTLISGCGNGSAGVKQWTPPSNKAAVNCYGVKPVSDDKLHKWNPTKWSRYD